MIVELFQKLIPSLEKSAEKANEISASFQDCHTKLSQIVSDLKEILESQPKPVVKAANKTVKGNIQERLGITDEDLQAILELAKAQTKVS